MELSTTTALALFQAGFSFSLGMFFPMFFLLTLANFLAEPFRSLGEFIENKIRRV